MSLKFKLGPYASPFSWQEGKGKCNGEFEADSLRLADLGTAPTAADAPGIKGDIVVDADFIYVCVDTDTWKRAALTTW